MKKIWVGFIFFAIFFTGTTTGFAQTSLDSILPVRGFCIAAPSVKGVDSFVVFINNELAPRKVNTLILRVDFNYQYKSHPELRDSIALSSIDVKKIVAACRANAMKVIPQVNLLGHQSWANKTYNLLLKYPQFDETPHVKMPAKYEWPNADSLYCKSYCPLHPELHKIVFALIDEICDAFETDAFHAGMDEVFYIGDDKCPRCHGKDKSVLFASEVTRIRDHLALSNRKLWIWGDRLLDGRTTGLGMWEASYNDTWRAIDMIPKDIMICDWHYERPDKTAVYFAMKGLNVVTCPWRNPSIAVSQLNDMINFRNESTAAMKSNFQGMVQTVWSGAEPFMRGYYENRKDRDGGDNTPWDCFRKMYAEIGKL
ncbi:MAG TPA: family 20 glycosylhydrolase [Agriterribacter sp.]|nr:family 20 glycosylhydrolase [Agriterribacter sp.]